MNIKWKYTLIREGECTGFRMSDCTEVSRLPALIGVCKHGGGYYWENGLYVINSWRLGYASLTPLICQGGGILVFCVQTGAFYFLSAAGATEQCDPAACSKSFHWAMIEMIEPMIEIIQWHWAMIWLFLTSKPSFLAIKFPNSLHNLLFSPPQGVWALTFI
jgi:hypothetical protein